jgi:hypothetical protein
MSELTPSKEEIAEPLSIAAGKIQEAADLVQRLQCTDPTDPDPGNPADDISSGGAAIRSYAYRRLS